MATIMWTKQSEKNMHTLGVAPSQDSRDHQDGITFLGAGISTNL